MNITVMVESIGAAGVVLVGVAAAAVYLCAKNVIVLGWSGWVFHRHIAAITEDPARLDPVTGARSGNPLIRIFSEAVRPGARGANDRRAELAFLCHKHLGKINRSMTLLRLISVISPLLGLLGTVLGIFKVFRIVGAQSVVNPAMLANGIWEALTTTILGLSITVPVLCFYYFFRMQIQGFQVELMEYTGRFAAPEAVR
ncbi:MAG: MotA/TolQ/ExbB proton channel family protein [Lentisphaerae bacterium]|nr:MotA/TolQ/ExbB proton channel family protein [Lentisphaerota bacterium]